MNFGYRLELKDHGRFLSGADTRIQRIIAPDKESFLLISSWQELLLPIQLFASLSICDARRLSFQVVSCV